MGDGEHCINSYVNARIVSMLSFLFLDAALQSGQGGAAGRGDGDRQTLPRANILIQLPTDFFYVFG